jgi:hypothetical protein
MVKTDIGEKRRKGIPMWRTEGQQNISWEEIRNG